MIFMIGCGTDPKMAPVTESEAMTVRATIDRAVVNTDARPLVGLMDTDELAKRVAKSTNGLSERELRKALGDGKSMYEFFNQFMTAVRSGRTLRFVRAYQEGPVWHLVYRLFGDGLNYLDWELGRNASGVKVEDIMVYVSGENLSETLASAASPESGLLDGNPTLSKDIRSLRRLMNEGDYEQAERIYASWPTSSKQHRLIRLIHTQILSGLGKDDEYARELEKLAVDFPESRNVPLLMIDVYFLQKKQDKALEAINRLDKMVGGDPFLEFYRAQVAKERGDTATYYKLVRKAFAAEKDIDAVAIEMMFVSILTNDTAGLEAAETALRGTRSYDAGLRSRLEELAKEEQKAGQ